MPFNQILHCVQHDSLALMSFPLPLLEGVPARVREAFSSPSTGGSARKAREAFFSPSIGGSTRRGWEANRSSNNNIKSHHKQETYGEAYSAYIAVFAGL